MTWTDERVEKLKEFWAEGMSASQIAKQLGGVTRNAVIGKVHRLGLSHRGNSAETTRAAEEPAAEVVAERVAEPVAEPAAAAPAAEVRTAPPPEPVRTPPAVRDPTLPRAPGLPTPEEEQARITLAEIEKIARKLDLLELTERTCKWPIGDPAEDNFYFCGLPSLPGKPYCEHHVAIAFQPMSNRRDRNRNR
ncbi:MAG: GcrA family cell cycle regulator [Pseudomonadota bacterium]